MKSSLKPSQALDHLRLACNNSTGLGGPHHVDIFSSPTNSALNMCTSVDTKTLRSDQVRSTPSIILTLRRWASPYLIPRTTPDLSSPFFVTPTTCPHQMVSTTISVYINTISRWFVPKGIRPPMLRALGSMLAAKAGIPIPNIMLQSNWPPPNFFFRITTLSPVSS